MNIHTKDFRVPEGDEVDLKKRPMIIDPIYKSKAHHAELLAEHVAKLSASTIFCGLPRETAGTGSGRYSMDSAIGLSTMIAVGPGSSQRRYPRREQSAQIGMIT